MLMTLGLRCGRKSIGVWGCGLDHGGGALGFVVKMHHVSFLEMLCLAISYLCRVFGGSHHL